MAEPTPKPTSETAIGQSDSDDWFDIDKYKKAAAAAYEYTKAKIQDTATEERKGLETAGAQERLGRETGGEQERLTLGTSGKEQRETIGKTGIEERTTAEQAQLFKQKDEERDYQQSQRAYRY